DCIHVESETDSFLIVHWLLHFRSNNTTYYGKTQTIIAQTMANILPWRQEKSPAEAREFDLHKADRKFETSSMEDIDPTNPRILILTVPHGASHQRASKALRE